MVTAPHWCQSSADELSFRRLARAATNAMGGRPFTYHSLMTPRTALPRPLSAATHPRRWEGKLFTHHSSLRRALPRPLPAATHARHWEGRTRNAGARTAARALCPRLLITHHSRLFTGFPRARE